MAKISLWIKTILVGYAVIEFFKFEKLEGDSYWNRTKQFCHTNIMERRPERTYGKALTIGSQVYTLRYRLWFRPFEIREGLRFRSFARATIVED